MNKKTKINLSSLVKLFIVTVVAGLLISVLTYAFIVPKEPTDTRTEKEITYYTMWSRTVFDTADVGNVNVTITVDGDQTDRLYSTYVRVWNSGKNPITDLPIRYKFSVSGSDLPPKIFSVSHETSPEYEFGNITLDETTEDSKKYVYELLNPGDEFVVTFLTDNRSTVEVYGKSEGVVFNENFLDYSYTSSEIDYLRLTILIFIMTISVGIATFSFYLASKQRRKQEVLNKRNFEEFLQLYSHRSKRDYEEKKKK